MIRNAATHSSAPREHFVRCAVLGLLAFVSLGSAAHAISAVWTRTVNGSANSVDLGRDTALAPNGDLYVVGHKAVTGQNANIWIRKYSPAGATKWTRTVDGPASEWDSAFGAAVDSVGNLYVVGTVWTSDENRNIWIRKYSSAGTKLWTRTVSGSANQADGAHAAAVDSADNLYVVGSTRTTSQGQTVWVRKYSPSGTKLWTRTGGGNSAYGAAVDSAGNLFVVGYIVVSPEVTNIWIRRYSSTGTKLWTRIVARPDSEIDTGNGAAVDSAGNLYVAGSIYVPGQSLNIWVRKYSSAGTKLWTRTANGSGNDVDAAYDVTVNADGAVIVIGEKELSGGIDVAWIRKYSPGGATRWTKTYAGPNNIAHGYGISVNATNRVYVTGDVWKAVQSDDIWVRKYRP